jgi:hypothetical protein
MSESEKQAISHLKGLLSMEEVARIGKTEKREQREVAPRKSSDLLTLSFTSGSTGVCPLLSILFYLNFNFFNKINKNGRIQREQCLPKAYGYKK